MIKPPSPLRDAFGIRELRPRTSLGFAGRARMLELWGCMDANQQDQALLAAAKILAQSDEPPLIPPSDAYDLQRGIAEEMAKGPVVRTGKK